VVANISKAHKSNIAYFDILSKQKFFHRPYKESKIPSFFHAIALLITMISVEIKCNYDKIIYGWTKEITLFRIRHFVSQECVFASGFEKDVVF
jgi:hypothetical protein